MQKYKCHKEVKAMKIETMEIWRDGSATLYAEGSCNGVSVKSEWMERNNPKPGGYYVNYMQDGYSSYSPEDAFEEGYTLITETEAA